MKDLNSDAIVQYYDFQLDQTWYKKRHEKNGVNFLLMENIKGVEVIDFFNNAYKVGMKLN